MQSSQLSKHFYLQGLPLLLAGLILFIIAGTINKKNPKPSIVLTKQDTAININQNLLLLLSVGNKRLISDMLWIQTLIESDEEHYSKKDLNSWMFHRFMSISSLDPQFYENYLYGGLYLSIAKDDVIGANELLNKGLRYYPNDYKLNYYAGFNYYFEQGKYAEGLKHLERIQDHPDAPAFIRLIVGKLKYETSGSLELALEFLKHEYETGQEPTIKQKLSFDIFSVQTEIDLNCLNKKGQNCNRLNPRGYAYKFDGKTWSSPEDYIPYRIRKAERAN